MTHFPNSLNVPPSVFQARDERNRHVVRAVTWGVSLRTLIIIGEMLGVIWFGSSALFMDALSSFVDVVCSLFLILFIKLAEKPPDADHPFGHGRYEPLAGLQLGLLLVIVGIGMLIQQGLQLNIPTVEHLDHRVWLIPFAALILLLICFFISISTAKKHNSTALAADAMHYLVDSITSLFATVALAIAAYFPGYSHTIDHLGAMAISGLMIVMGAFAMRSNLHQLLDKIPNMKYFQIVRNASKNVPGVKDTEKIRIQLYGPDAHVDIDIEVDPDMSVEKAHEISQHVRVAIQKDWPVVRDVTVHIEPYYPGDH